MSNQRLAVVTGAARGIGRAIALRFAADGANRPLLSRTSIVTVTGVSFLFRTTTTVVFELPLLSDRSARVPSYQGMRRT